MGKGWSGWSALGGPLSCSPPQWSYNAGPDSAEEGLSLEDRRVAKWGAGFGGGVLKCGTWVTWWERPGAEEDGPSRGQP